MCRLMIRLISECGCGVGWVVGGVVCGGCVCVGECGVLVGARKRCGARASLTSCWLSVALLLSFSTLFVVNSSVGLTVSALIRFFCYGYYAIIDIP